MGKIAVVFLLGLWTPYVVGKTADPAPLFATEQALKAVLTAPISQAYKQKKQDKRLYLDGFWSYKAGESTRRLPVKIRTRGNFRRETCSLPPLQLNFRKKTLVGTELDGQDKLKMVSPCKRGSRYQQLVYLEHLVYRLFALYSDLYFKVRLVDLAYVDSDGRKDPWQSVNFLIEDRKDLAARSGLSQVDIIASQRRQMDLPHTALVELFQFMIGNVDYSTLQSPPGERCCHNVVLLGDEDATGGFLPVPYDFDASGIVNAPYASPPEGVPIKRVTERYFRGWCKEERRFRAAIDKISQHQQEAIALFAHSPLLNKKYRERSADYLRESYQLINDPQYVERYIIGRCRGEVIKG